MLGQGRIALHGEIMPAAEALQRLELEPLALGPKEGLALINGTQVSTAIALDALFAGERVFASGLIAGGLSIEALRGTDAAFDPRTHDLRGQPGQNAVAKVQRQLPRQSEIRQSHTYCEKVQDPYSFRCQHEATGEELA